MGARNHDHVKGRLFLCQFQACHAWRQALADRMTLSWQALPFYTASTPRISERSRLRRGFVSRSPVSCRPEPNDFQRLVRRGELLLRVVRLEDASWAESQARSGVRVLRALIEQGRDRRRQHSGALEAIATSYASNARPSTVAGLQRDPTGVDPLVCTRRRL